MQITIKQIITFLLIVVWVEINSLVLYYDCFHIGHHDVNHGLIILFFVDGLAEFIVTPFSYFLSNQYYDFKFGVHSVYFDVARIIGIPISMIFYRLIFWLFNTWYYDEDFF